MSFRDTLLKLLSGAQPGAEKTKLGRGSNTSLGHGFVAVCNNCGGAGLYHSCAGRFGGGDVPHPSACNPCGASFFRNQLLFLSMDPCLNQFPDAAIGAIVASFLQFRKLSPDLCYVRPCYVRP
jgi:hypothetical protein